MKIGEVAAGAGVSIDTVRFYERRGVLPEPERTASGYRTYTDASVERLGSPAAFSLSGSRSTR